MNSNRFLLIILILITSFLLLGISKNKSNKTGFIGDSNKAGPISESYKGEVPEIYIEDPENIVVIIYSHGNGDPTEFENCSAWWNDVPDSLKDLTIKKEILVFYLCSSATDKHFKPGLWVFDRVIEIEEILDKLILVGVKPNNIFLSGHSAGAWSSLLSMERVGLKFNSAIIFAPACCGPRYERHPIWRGRVRPLHVHKMLGMDRIEALIFAYTDDPYNRPEDLMFLQDSYLDSIEIIGYNCGQEHLTHLKDCRLEETNEKIIDYIRYRQLGNR